MANCREVTNETEFEDVREVMEGLSKKFSAVCSARESRSSGSQDISSSWTWQYIHKKQFSLENLTQW